MAAIRITIAQNITTYNDKTLLYLDQGCTHIEDQKRGCLHSTFERLNAVDIYTLLRPEFCEREELGD